MHLRTLLIHTLLYGLVFLWAGSTHGPVNAVSRLQAGSPALSIGVVATAPGSTVTVPVTFQSNGAGIGALGFSIRFDDICLTYGSSALQVPATHNASILNVVDSDGDTLIDQLNVLIFAFSPTPVTLPAIVNPIVTLTVTAKSACTGTNTPIIFSGDTSFNDATTTLPIPGSTTNGMVTIGSSATTTPSATPIPTNTPTLIPTVTPLPITPTATATPVVSPTHTPTVVTTPSDASLLLISAGKNGTVGGVSFQDEDILAYDAAANRWSLLFDGSAVGLSKINLTAFDLLPDGTFLLTLSKSLSIPSLGTVTPSDVLRFVPTALGQNTTGHLEWYFDGSDVDLTTSSEYIDALALDDNGRLLLSTAGAFKIGKTTLGDDEDLYAFTHTTLGLNTAGTWSLFFDGSRVALTQSDEDVDAAWVARQNSTLYFSTKGKFTAAGTVNAVSGDKNDLFRCTPLALGATTNCNFALVFDGDAVGFAYDIDDLAFVAANQILPFTSRNTTAAAVDQYDVVMTDVELATTDPELTAVDQKEEEEEETPVQRVLLPIIVTK